ncbi:sulfopyruvate decarboxylase subunit alpha [Methanolobus halotolerans]|uniref:sulfopyruvate decarboxylase n=1 Tax=Methanolobus halotolerans TaxID=2052935 RepID=A0A4E0Q1M4_9EURY|nr:sulfopyruvate decarboxylase subunit alpha [Methanolobus halotolerans]TGC10995.1 sulfopyruvate decarboxylase subunit alpha [Methanolobus halotolerans]
MSGQNELTPPEAVYLGIKNAGIDFIVSVPCINLRELIPMIGADPDIIHVPVTREEEGVGVCAGAFMGGKRPAMLMQNSGLGNSINSLASLNRLYGIPLLMIMSHRGVEGEPICAQIPMGQLTVPLLDTLCIPYFLPDSKQEATEMIFKAVETAFDKKKPVALLLPISFWRQS